jgi:hypothetical protein
MPNDESEPGGNVRGGAGGNDSVGGGGGGHAALGGAGAHPNPPRALFMGFVFPSPLDENGALNDQPLNRGLGEPHLFTLVYAYNDETEGTSRDLHAEADGILGRPFFKAYIYPVTEHNDGQLPSVSGGGGGHAALGGAPGAPIYLGQFRATIPGNGDSEDDPDTGSGSPPNG